MVILLSGICSVGLLSRRWSPSWMDYYYRVAGHPVGFVVIAPLVAQLDCYRAMRIGAVSWRRPSAMRVLMLAFTRPFCDCLNRIA